MSALSGIATALLAAFSMSAATLEIDNQFGAVRVEIVDQPQLKISGRTPEKLAAAEELQLERRLDRVTLTTTPLDGRRLDVDVRLPLGFALEVKTRDGDIAVSGMTHRARFETETGALRLTAPWRGARLTLDAEQPPPQVELPREPDFSRNVLDVSGGRTLWRLRDLLPENAIVYGDYRARAVAPRAVTLQNYSPPPEWPLKFPWQAPAALERILQGPPPPKPSARPEGAEVEREAQALFRSDVRMVSFAVAVEDAQGRPLAGLQPDDFTVLEDGEPQEVAFAGSEQAPFNLAILLDLSGSTRPDRRAMAVAVRRFIDVAQAGDRIAVYALAGGLFHVVSPLSSDRQALLKRIESLPEVSGPSPLYDMITLAYAEELFERPGERNALIVISDGIDNQISNQEAPSNVKFKKLVKAAEEMHALIYPIFLRSGERFGRGWSKKAAKRLERLAEAARGRVFPAGSIDDLEPIYPQVEAELRSVYGVAYYPKNQSFDGSWRRVEVEVDRPQATVRARPGYFAR